MVDAKNIKSIHVSRENYLDLFSIKYENNFRNFNQVITLLLNQLKGGKRRK